MSGQEFNLCGIGLREPHFNDLLIGDRKPVWLEWLIDNYMDLDEEAYRGLTQIRERYQVAFHGVGLNIASKDPIDLDYVNRLKELSDYYEPFILSDHLSFVKWDGRYHHDLLPVVMNSSLLSHVVERLDQVQNLLERPILLENATNYLCYSESSYEEPEFLKEIARRSGCGLLLDINNVWVNSVNHQFDPWEYLCKLRGAPIGQIHLAGHLKTKLGLVDTHGTYVNQGVWDLFERYINTFGKVPTLIEWDRNIPPLEDLLSESIKANRLLECANFPTPQNNGTPTEAGDNSDLVDSGDWQFPQQTLSLALTQTNANLAPFPSSDGMTAEQGLNIYQRNHIMLVRDELLSIFPKTREALSPGNFDFFCREYAREGAAFVQLGQLAEGFPAFLQSHELLKGDSSLLKHCEQELKGI